MNKSIQDKLAKLQAIKDTNVDLAVTPVDTDQNLSSALDGTRNPSKALGYENEYTDPIITLLTGADSKWVYDTTYVRPLRANIAREAYDFSVTDYYGTASTTIVGECFPTVGNSTYQTFTARSGEIGVQRKDVDRFLNDVVKRQGIDFTGPDHRVGDSKESFELRMLARIYKDIVAKTIAIGDPTITGSFAGPASSLSSQFITANYVDVIALGSADIETAFDFELSRMQIRGTLPNMAGSVFLTHELGARTIYQRAIQYNQNGTNSNPRYRVEGDTVFIVHPAGETRVVGSRSVPVDTANALTEGYFIPAGHVGLWSALNAPRQYMSEIVNSTTAAGCYAKTLQIVNNVAVLIRNPLSLFKMTGIPTWGGQTTYTNYTNAINANDSGLVRFN